MCSDSESTSPRGSSPGSSPGFPCALSVMGIARSILELVRQADAASRIVLRRRALGDRGAVTQTRLQLQMFGQVDVDLHLTGSGRGLLAFDVHTLADIPSGRDCGAGILRACGR